MPAGYLDLFVEKNADFETQLSLTDVNGSPMNLVNFLVYGSIKKSYVSANTVANFTITVANTQGGLINVSLSKETTANLKTLSTPRHVYDIVIKDTTSNTVSRILEGTIYPQNGVTRL